jgi:hypothetical protein
MAYSAMGAAFLATAPSAEAAIVYHDPPDIVVENTAPTDSWQGFLSAYLFLDLDGNATGTTYFPGADLRFLAGLVNWYFPGTSRAFGSFYGGTSSWADNAVLAYAYNTNNPVHPSWAGLKKFGAGSLVGPSQNFSTGYFFPASGTTNAAFQGDVGPFGVWHPWPSTGYLGVRFGIGGNTHYGWVQIEQYYTLNPQPLARITILDYAYEDVPNTPIPAGAAASPSIPTLSEWGLITFVLLLLSFGTIYVGRRKEAYAMQGEDGNLNIGAIFQKPPFDLAIFRNTLLGTGILGAALGALSIALTGTITLVDVIGFGVAGPVFAYLAHLVRLFEGRRSS